MNDWDSIYREKGVVQKKPLPEVIKSIDLLKKNNARRVLDLGCGTGRHTMPLAEKGFDVYGCDISETALEKLGEMLPSANLKKCGMDSLSYEDSFFDAVLCICVIQHARIEMIGKAVQEIHRVLRKDGLLVLVTITDNDPKAKTGEEIEPNTRINVESIDGQIPHHFFSEGEIKHLFKKFDILKLGRFEKTSDINFGKLSRFWLMIAQKRGQKI